MRKLFTLFLMLSICNIVEAQERVSLSSSSGNIKWEVEPISSEPALQRVAAVVPGCVFTSYVEAGVEADPNFGDNVHRVDKARYDRDFLYIHLHCLTFSLR